MSTSASDQFDAYAMSVNDDDRSLFRDRLGDFVPPNSFDAHAHLFSAEYTGGSPKTWMDDRDDTVSRLAYDRTMRDWMGDRAPTNGLFFAFPHVDTDTAKANHFLAEEVRADTGSRGLLLVTPQCDPVDVDTQLNAPFWAGIKVYHVYASRPDTRHASINEFLTDWMWEIAHQKSLVIMLHMVKATALSDVDNQRYIRQYCLRYAGAKLILAHCGRSFAARHTVDGIHALRGLDNVFFDNSGICEAAPMEAILREFGPSRLFFGTDHPISSIRGRCCSIADGFMWTDATQVDWTQSTFAQPTLVGIESLLALQQAARTMSLTDSDVEQIFCGAARELLGIDVNTPPRPNVQNQYRKACTVIPGGTQLLSKRPEMAAPNRWPPYYEEARGCEIVTTDGKHYVDMAGGGILACILGYSDPDVNAAVLRRVQFGSMTTLQTYDDVELAELMVSIHPWAERARFARTGGESMAIAVRIARARTGRDKVVICGYHGWHDWYLAANLGEDGTRLDGHLLPGLAPTGVPRALSGTALTFRYNRLDELDAILEAHGPEIAAVVMEPTRYVDPSPGFLAAVKERAHAVGARLIFDEITVSWRLCLGGAHIRYGVTPDIAVFAKGISNGFPMAAVIGTAETMDAAQDSFISSTYWSEGIGPAAAVATIRKMQRIDVPSHLARIGNAVRHGWDNAAQRHNLPFKSSGRPEMTVLAMEHPQAAELSTLFTARMLDHGFLASTGFNPMLAHTDEHVHRYLAAVDPVFAELARALENDDVLERLGTPIKHTGFARLT